MTQTQLQTILDYLMREDAQILRIIAELRESTIPPAMQRQLLGALLRSGN